MPDEIPHVTVRVPELPAATELTAFDKIIVWQAADNKTKHADITTVMAFMGTGGNGQIVQPVINGQYIIHDVTAAEDGATVVSIPAIANQSFHLVRDGRALIEGTDFEILSTGGFKIITPGDFLIEGQRFSLNVYTLAGSAPGGTPGGGLGGGGTFLDGSVLVNSNITMTAANHLKKLIQVRSAGLNISITLPDLTDVPDNTIIPFESSVGCDFQTIIKTQGGQYIYWKGQSLGEMYIGPSESLWLFKDPTGFFVIQACGNWNDVGKIQTAYKVEVGELLADGSLKSRVDWPRLWEWVQTLGGSLVSDSTWSTASATVAGRTVPNPYRGCFSTGDGSTTFRVPDMMNSALRGLKNIFGSDSERHLNRPGGFQLDEVISHSHSYNKNNSQSNSDAGGTPDYVAQTPFGTTGSYGGTETRMMNIGVLWTIKA